MQSSWNINKTLAIKHQQQMCTEGPSIRDEIECGKPHIVVLESMNEYQECLSDYFGCLKDILTTQWLRINGFEYRKNISVIQNGYFHAIHKIFLIENKYYFLCTLYEILCFDEFLNSFNVKETRDSKYILIELGSLKNKKCYETIFLGKEEYIIEEDLEIRKLCNLNGM